MGMVGRSQVRALCVVGLLLGGCEEQEPAAVEHVPGLEEAGSVAGEGVGAGEWSRALGLGDSQALRAAVASNGDVLLVAAYGKPVDLGGGPLPFDREVRSPHVLVARFSSEGALRWARGLVPRAPGAVRAQVGAIGVTRGGEVLLSGTSPGFQLGDAWLPEGPFLARLTPEGALGWVRSFRGEGPLTVGALAVEPGSGDVVLAGDFSGQRDFGAGEHRVPMDRMGAFVARFTAEGAPSWSRAYGTRRGDASARAVAVDVFGEVVVAGSYSGAMSFGGATFVTVQPRTPYLLKLSPQGAHRWSRELGGADGTAQAVAVGVDRVFLAGSYQGRFSFRDERFESDWQDGFVVAYSGEGQSRWGRSFAASATALASDGAGQVMVAGAHDGGLDVGHRSWGPGLYVTKLLPEDGTSIWARGFVGTGSPHASTVAVDATGHALVAGTLARSRGSAVPPTRDGFFLRLRP
jgi:outer membrane protein assembly factor BamB